tara:strand:- start:1044 stop:1634 length:591 start_codon:yes stop_codon:yes gene_type:complete
MNKKIFIQAILLLTVLVLILSFYLHFFENRKTEVEKTKINNEYSKIEQENIINDLQYFSKDENGNTYLLNAKTGYADENNTNIIYLTGVNAKIIFDNNNEILVTSDKAVYNNSSYDTNFLGNVLITYGKHKLTTKSMNALISKNLAILSGEIVYQDDITSLYADKIEYDLLKRTSKISMFEKNKKVKIKHLNNGIN